MKTNAFFQLFVAVVCVMCVGCTGKRKAQPVDVLAKETPPAVQSPEVTMIRLQQRSRIRKLLQTFRLNRWRWCWNRWYGIFLSAVLFLRIRFICIQNMIIIL